MYAAVIRIQHKMVASEIHAPIDRQLGPTEHNFCRAVASGTGITVLALQLSPGNLDFQNILDVLRESHPLLSCKLHYDPAAKAFAFRQPSSSPLSGITFHDAPATLALLRGNKTPQISPLQKLLEHELNNNAWSDPNSFPREGADVVLGSVYPLSKAKCVVVIRFHTSVCDRTTAVSLLREMMEVAATADGDGLHRRLKNAGEGEMSLESLIPIGLNKKRIWSHGRDMLGYSLNSLRMTNMEFKDKGTPRASEVVRLKMDLHDTSKILAVCKSRGVKLCGALSAAAMLAAHSVKNYTDKVKKKYGLITFTDCRSDLETPLSNNHFGFYHSAVLNIHTIKGIEPIWELASTCYGDFERYKTNKKHFTDMADLNFLMIKAIDNPGLTPSSSLRTSLVSVFEDPVIDNSGDIQQKIGVDDYIGCSSIHGIGPSIAIFDTIRNGQLDCTIVYPSPLHSREQIEEIAQKMKKVLIDGSSG